MYSSKLSSPIDISHLYRLPDIEDYIYDFFKRNLMNSSYRKKLHGKFIYMNCNQWINYKNEVFWHISSLNENEKFNILPCNNCLSSEKCPLNCISPTRKVIMKNKETRNICLYRAIRINWINEIIELANNGDESIKTWNKKILGKGKNKQQYFVRFTHEAVDYILLFEEKYKNGILEYYYFITAFPIFYINSKRKYDEDYLAYQQSLTFEK